jgi:DNA-binding transcriptional MerR regulator
LEYKIKEIANILDLSTEMIRYYEKMGVVKPKRDNSNYRVYDNMDLLSIMEAMQLKELNVRIKNISEIKSNEYTQNAISYYKKSKEKLLFDIEYMKLKVKRLDDLIERYQTSNYNLENYWVKEIPSFYKYYMLESDNDEYYEVELDKKIFSELCSKSVIPFLDGLIEINKNKEYWYLGLDKIYGDFLNTSQENREIQDKQLCLCTIVDMGEIGEFNRKCIEPMKKYSENKGYEQDGTIYGLLCERGTDEGHYHRYMELRMPIKKKA